MRLVSALTELRLLVCSPSSKLLSFSVGREYVIANLTLSLTCHFIFSSFIYKEVILIGGDMAL